MAAVLYYGNADRLTQILEPFFADRKTDAGEIHSLTRAPDAKIMDELIEAVTFDLIFVEQAILDRLPGDWLGFYKKKFPKLDCPFILLGDERDPAKILKNIEIGFTDYIVNPPDKPLILEKFMVYSTGKRSGELRQVYSLKLSQAADLAKPGYIEELSEFDCKVRSGQPAQVGEMMILYATAFADEGAERSAVLGRCYACQEHESFKGQFLASFYFIGVTPDILTYIRKSLQKSYIASKNK